MKFRDPWIDPRIVQVRPQDAEAYLRGRGWKPLGPAPANPDLLLFDGPKDGEDNPLLPVPRHMDQGPDVQRMIELVTELARFEGRYAVDVLNDILREGAATGAANEAGQDQANAIGKT